MDQKDSSTTRSKGTNPEETGEEVTDTKENSGSLATFQSQKTILLRGLQGESSKAHREQRFSFDHDIRASVPRPIFPVAQFSQKSIKTSAMHEESMWDVLFIPGLRSFIKVSKGVSRMAQLVYLCPLDNAMIHTPDAYLLISICKTPSVLPAGEYHPRNLRILLNDQMVQGLVPNGVNPYPQIPLEIPISALRLQEENVFQIYWLESTAEERAMDYYLYIYVAKRKPVKAIVAAIETNLLSATESLAREYNQGKDSDIMAGTRTLHLNDPISRQRIALPVRGKQCRHLECFDAASFVSMNFGPAARFLCPLCAQIVLPQELVVDQFFLELLRFTTGDRIELVQDAKGITVRECVKKTVQHVITIKTVGPLRHQNSIIRPDDGIGTNGRIASTHTVLDPASIETTDDKTKMLRSLME